MCFSPIYPPLSLPNFFSHHKTWPSLGPKNHHWFPTKDTWRSGRTPNYYGEESVLVSSEQGFHCVSLDTLPCFKRWDFSGKSHRLCGGGGEDGTGNGRKWGGQGCPQLASPPSRKASALGRWPNPRPTEDHLPVVSQSLCLEWSFSESSCSAQPLTVLENTPIPIQDAGPSWHPPENEENVNSLPHL